jgi:glycosyltransferase involved in cell wall biosynthesis
MTTPLSLVGYPFMPTGMGEHIRSTMRAFQAVGLAPTLVDVADHQALADPDLERDFRGFVGKPAEGGINLFCVNGDEAPRVIERVGRMAFESSYNIVYPAWELAHYPRAWARVLERFHEAWAPSAFVAKALAESVHRPVTTIPLAVDLKLSAFLGRRWFAIPEDAFVVLFFFDFTSFAARKNPEAVLACFERLTLLRPQANLHCVIKTRGGRHDDPAHQALEARIATLDGRARLITGDLSDNEIKNLVRNCDAFVSLHRSEGFGRGMAEAMALGRPAVATGYSGNLDFMTPETSRLVDYRLIPVAPGAYPRGEGQVWAEASPEHAAQLLAELVDDPDAARELGRRARRHIRVNFSARAIGLRCAERLEEIDL